MPPIKFVPAELRVSSLFHPSSPMEPWPKFVTWVVWPKTAEVLLSRIQAAKFQVVVSYLRLNIKRRIEFWGKTRRRVAADAPQRISRTDANTLAVIRWLLLSPSVEPSN